MEYYICGHPRRSHSRRPSKLDFHCEKCYNNLLEVAPVQGIRSGELMACFHEFKLDNLKLIEDLAKAKGLV
jgi:hypothetical protein